MIKIAGTGLSGLVGSRISDILKNKYQFENLSLETGVDITDKKSLEEKLKVINPDFILHLAAKTDVDGCERDKELDTKVLEYKDIKLQEEEWKANKTAWWINVIGTENVASVASSLNKKFIYISTDFVFDGEKESYTEEDDANPLGWYAATKHEGEKITKGLNTPWLILRLSYPYRSNFEKTDLVRTFINLLKTGRNLNLIADHFMKPTFIDDIASALDVLIETNSSGIFHTVGSTLLSPYELAGKICHEFGFDRKLLSQTTREEYFAGKAPRPYKLNLKNDKITKLGVKMRTVDEGLAEIRKQNNNL